MRSTNNEKQENTAFQGIRKTHHTTFRKAMRGKMMPTLMFPQKNNFQLNLDDLPIGPDRCRNKNRKFSDLARLVGKRLVGHVGVLWTSAFIHIGHIDQKSQEWLNIINYFDPPSILGMFLCLAADSGMRMFDRIPILPNLVYNLMYVVDFPYYFHMISIWFTCFSICFPHFSF